MPGRHNTDTIRHRVLTLLGVYGPTSVAHLAHVSGLRRDQVYRSLYVLEQQFLAARLDRAAYDVTARGRRHVCHARPLLEEPPPCAPPSA